MFVNVSDHNFMKCNTGELCWNDFLKAILGNYETCLKVVGLVRNVIVVCPNVSSRDCKYFRVIAS